MVEAPESEDVGVFAAIVLLQEVEARRDHCGKSHPAPVSITGTTGWINGTHRLSAFTSL